MNLRTKILLGYGLVLALTLVVWGSAVVDLRQLGLASEAILEDNFQSILAAENMIDTIERQDSALLLLMLGFETEGQNQFRQNELEFLGWLGRAKDNITLENEGQILETIEAEYLDYLASASQLRDLQLAQPQAAAGFYHETVLPKFKRVRDTCIELRDLNQDAMVAASEMAHGVSVRAIWSLLGIGAAAAALGLIFSLWLSHVLARPLQEMALATERIAEGDYEVTISTQSSDELGLLARRIMNMSRKLKAFHDLNVSHLIAEKRHSEAIIHSIADGLVVVDQAFNITAINPPAAEIFKIGPAEARGRHIFDVISNPALYDQIKATAETGQPPALDEEQATLAIEDGGRVRYYKFAITPVKQNEHGQMLGVILLLQDVTTLKELDRLKDEFVMTASHELRSPLTGIAMSIGLLAENARDKLSESDQALLEAAQEDVYRLRALVNDLLDLSKIESGRIEMEFEPVEVELLMEKAVSTFIGQAEREGIELTWQAPAALPAVRADPNKITWVLTNLIGNAVRYTGAGGHICVSARSMRDFVYLSVADDGAGIPLEYQSKIFDKFVQVKTGRAVGGSGLGLAICKEIIRAHGGTIWVESAPDEGSTFTFTLPISVTPQPDLTKGEAHDVYVQNPDRG